MEWILLYVEREIIVRGPTECRTRWQCCEQVFRSVVQYLEDAWDREADREERTVVKWLRHALLAYDVGSIVIHFGAHLQTCLCVAIVIREHMHCVEARHELLNVHFSLDRAEAELYSVVRCESVDGGCEIPHSVPWRCLQPHLV